MMQLLWSRLKISHILLAGLVVRVLAMIVFVNPEEVNFWEYGFIAQHLLNGHGFSYSFVDVDGNFLDSFYPSALVPPGYVAFLLPFYLVKSLAFRVYLLIFVQIGISVFSIWKLYQLASRSFNPGIGLLAAIIFAFMPEMIYTPQSVGPTVLFQCLLLMFLTQWLQADRNSNRNLLFLGFLAGLLIYLRTEVLLFLLLMIAWEVARSKTIKPVFVLLLAASMMAPWVWRNYQVFNTPLFTTNMGVNLYRGHNPEGVGNWGAQHTDLFLKLQQESGDLFELNFNKAWQQMAVEFIKNNPTLTLKSSVMKIGQFWVFDWTDERSWHVLYLLPWLVVLALGIAGVWQFGMRLEHFLLFASYTFIVMVFFAQIRYQAIVKPVFLIYAAAGLSWLIEKNKARISDQKMA